MVELESDGDLSANFIFGIIRIVVSIGGLFTICCNNRCCLIIWILFYGLILTASWILQLIFALTSVGWDNGLVERLEEECGINTGGYTWEWYLGI